MKVHSTIYKYVPYDYEYALWVMGQSTFGTSGMPPENTGPRMLRTIGMLEIFIVPVAYHYKGEFSWYIRDTLTNSKSVP